jgi:glycosyltransferase involved in cell wall biosynthesis
MPDSSPPPRIGFNALLLSVDPGYRAAGIHRYIVSLLTALAETDGASVVAFVPRPWPGDALPQNIDLWRAPASAARPTTRILWEQASLPSALVRSRAQVYHGAAYSMPAAARCPSVVTIHDLSPFRHAASLPRWKGFYLRAATRHAARGADALIAVSQFTADEIVEVLGVPPQRIHVIPNGVDDRFGDVPQRDIAAARARLGLPDTFVLTLGTLQPRKNLRTLLEAYAAMRRARADTPDLVIVGGAGWGDVDVRAAVDGLSIGAHVHVLGYVNDEDLPPLYAAATVFAYPSRYEGFGLPVLEAMACGTPAVVATGSSLTEVVGANAPTAAPLDVHEWATALTDLLDDAARRDALGRDGRARAAGYTWARAAKATTSVYRHVLGDRDLVDGTPRG